MAIVWLASYPKSGNTWLRVFLANLLANQAEPLPLGALSSFVFSEHSTRHYERVAGVPVDRLTKAQINGLRPAVHRALPPKKGQLVFVKTHAAVATVDGIPTITGDVTRGAIYIIRNPLDVAVSYAHHFGVGFDRAIEAMRTRMTKLAASRDFVEQPIGSWSIHVESWVSQTKALSAVIRYEDMIEAPETTFAGLVRTLRMPVEEDRVQRAIRFSAFPVLQDLEAKQGFVERSKHADRFFRKGQSGAWQDALTPAQVDSIVRDHGPVMRRFGYLDEDGQPLAASPPTSGL